MNSYIGIDLGTSAVKLLLVGADGSVLNRVSIEYPVYYPQSGWSEQNPKDWVKGVISGIKSLLLNENKKNVKGISFGGQMHGLVMLDIKGEPIRPAILWNDGRTEKQTEYLNNVIGKEALDKYTANIAFAGFTAPKVLWIKENEPENFKKIAKIMLPKDYIAYVLTGKFSCDVSDASGTLFFDVQNRCWSEEMCKICCIRQEWLPPIYESSDVIGNILPSIAEELGLNNEVKIIAGAGDNAAAAIGTGTVKDGLCNVSLGTSGTVFISSKNFAPSKNNALHSFCHANGEYHLMGCMLSAASCCKWWVEDILKSQHDLEQTGAEEYLGKNDIFFMPYLMGERSPHNDVNARGAFIGMRANTPRVKLTLSVLEGVSFGLKDSIERAKENVDIFRVSICGGGSRSQLWRRIIANVFNMPVDVPLIEEGPSYGAAILAMVGAKEYPSLDDAIDVCIKIKETTYPDEKLAKLYEEKYKIFKELYPNLKDTFKKIV